jgi:hypothetical protein
MLAVVFAVLSVFFVSRLLLSNGATFGNYFVTRDWADTSMDFFNPLSFFAESDPYSSNSNYPAFCAALFKVFRLFLPDDAPVDAFELRVYMPAQIVYITMLVGCLFLIAFSLLRMTDKLGERQRIAVCAVVVFSGPMIFSLERGNIILLAFALTILFVAEYKSDSSRARWGAYIALAIAAGLKVYPCVFALLVLRNGHREFIGVCALSAIALIAPFFAFDGFESIGKMLGGMGASTNDQIGLGLGHQFSFSFLIRDIAAFAGVRLRDISVIWQVAAMLICLFLFVVARKEWMKVFALALACVWVPSFAATYSLLFFAIPAILFVCEADIDDLSRLRLYEVACSVSFAFIMAPLAFPRVSFRRVLTAWPHAVSPLTYGELAIQLAILIILVYSVFSSVRDNRQSRRLTATIG